MTALLVLALLAAPPAPPEVVRGVVRAIKPQIYGDCRLTLDRTDVSPGTYATRFIYPSSECVVRFRGVPGSPRDIRLGDRVVLVWHPPQDWSATQIDVDRDLDMPMAFAAEAFVVSVCDGRSGCGGLDPIAWGLVEGLGADRCKVRDWAARMLEQQGEKVWKELAHGLGHRDPEVRDRAARLAGPMVGVVAIREPDEWEAK
jgi:hypothetical protein